jgi:23S rRNA pseudouridine1911/1915/1917 synthase
MSPAQRGEADLEVLFEDNHLLALHKPAGLPVVPDESGDVSLFELAKGYLKRRYQKPGEVFLGVVHRLDRPVSGLVLFARTSKAAARLSAQWRAHAVSKRYLALGQPGPLPRAGEHSQWLQKDEAARRVRVLPGPRAGALEARTRLTARALPSGTLAFELEPLTGRPHQLRVLCASLGAPLLGDLKYGAAQALPDRSIALHAERLSFEHPTQRQALELSTPPPATPWWAELSAGRGPAGGEQSR